jgi:hypothetical protein
MAASGAVAPTKAAAVQLRKEEDNSGELGRSGPMLGWL